MQSLSYVKHSIFKATKICLDYIQNGENLLFKYFQNQKGIPFEISKQIIHIKESVSSYSPFTITIFTIILIFILQKFIGIIIKIKRSISKYEKFSDYVTAIYLSTSFGKKKANLFFDEVRKDLNDVFNSSKFKKLEFRDNEQEANSIIQKMDQIAKGETEKSNCGKLTGAVYCADGKIRNIANDAMRIFSYSNLLHCDIYNGARFIESQLIKLGVSLFNGKDDACGMTTNGGTMSILAAMYSYAHRAREMGIETPNIIVPLSAHAAFFKACEMFRLDCIKIPLDPITYKMNISKVKRVINKNTACIVGSFPNFPHSIADDIESLSDLAVKYKIPLHVDCCLGGFLIAFYRGASINTAKFDFSLPGVTSISADLHKFGMGPKGISLLLFSKREYRKYNYFVYPHFMGGIYCTPSFEGSRTGALSAAAYAVLISLGKNYYTNIARKINEAVLKVKKFIKEECDLIQVIGEPYICGFAFKGDKVEYFYDEMSRRHWHFNYIINPIGCSFVFTSANVDNVDLLINDLRETHAIIKQGKQKPLEKLTKFYGMTAPLPKEIGGPSLQLLIDAMLD